MGSMSPRVIFALPSLRWDGLPPAVRDELLAPGGIPLAWSRRGNRVESAPVSPRSALYRAASEVGQRVDLWVIVSGDRRCRICGCVEELACDDGCSWADTDLCSACVDRATPLPSVPVTGGGHGP